jgi:hypothetical protein
MRLPNGAEVAFVDWNDKPLYSTLDLLAGFTDQEILAFTYVVGDQVPATVNATVSRTASENDTNVSTPGSMASTEEMLVYAIRPEIHELRTDDGTPTDMTSASIQVGGQPNTTLARLGVLSRNLLMRLEVSQKIMQRAGFGYFQSGFGPFGNGIYAGAPLAAPRSSGNHGLPSQEAVRSYVIPIHIGGQEKYDVRLENTAGVTVQSGITEEAVPTDDDQIVHRVRIYLDGLYKRPVS